jgi:N6-L-threonylcarbamoyladenine synthase
MKILAIETSCDETAVAIVEATGGLDNPQFNVLSKAINSQIDIHTEFGGVFPTLAKREHAINIVPVLEQCLLRITNSKSQISNKLQITNLKLQTEIKEILSREEGLYESTIKLLEEFEKPKIDMIAVTSGPGLEPALWVGINFARALSIAWQIPLIDVNHMEGHITSVLLKQNRRKSEILNPKIENNEIEFPALGLLISGGHTEIVDIEKWNQYKILGKTRDDAVGESYDKVARLLGFPYPGGPQISAMAQKFRNSKSEILNSKLDIKFPRPMINSNDLDFSFSGLKTAVLYKIKDLTKLENQIDKNLQLQIAAEFEESVKDVLVSKLNKALTTKNYKSIIVGGGVVANQFIKSKIKDLGDKNEINTYFPEKSDSTDNAQMIACAGYLKSFKIAPKIGTEIKAIGGLTY